MPLPAFSALLVETRVMLALTLILTALGSGSVLAQTKVRTETIRPPAGATAPPSATQFVPQDGGAAASGATATPPAFSKPTGPEIAADLAHLPPAVLRTRQRILAAARTGDLQALLEVMRASGNMPVFSHTQKQDPAAYCR